MLHRKTEMVSNTLMAAVIVIAINLIASVFHMRFDITDDDQFTLTEGTKSISQGIVEPVEIKVFFSKSAENVPVQVKNYAQRVEDVLREVVAQNTSNLRVQFIDPRPDTDEELEAQRYGLQAVNLPAGSACYFGAVFLQGAQEVSIPFFDPSRSEQLEYDISEALLTSSQSTKSKIGVLSTLPVMGEAANPMDPRSQMNQGWVAFEELKKRFEIKALKADAIDIPKDLLSLVVVHPAGLSDGTLYAIDQFVMRGGNLIVLADPFNRISLNMGGQQAMMQGAFASDLSKLLGAYGVEVTKEVVADRMRATQIGLQGQPFSYPAFLSLTDENTAVENPMTKNLSSIMLSEAGAVRQKEGSEVVFEALITSSEQASLGAAFTLAMQGPIAFSKNLSGDEKKRTLSALVKGKFTSAFAAGAPDGASEKMSAQHKKERTTEGLMLIVADADFISDQNSVQSFRMGNQIMLNPINDNLAFFLNAVETLSGKQELIGIRSKAKISRPFTRLEEIQSKAQKNFQEEEQRLSNKLEEIQKKISEMNNNQIEDGKVALDDDLLGAIKKFRKEQATVKTELRKVRKKLREDIETVGTYVKLINLLLFPVLVFLLGLVVYHRRSNLRNRGGNP